MFLPDSSSLKHLKDPKLERKFLMIALEHQIVVWDNYCSSLQLLNCRVLQAPLLSSRLFKISVKLLGTIVGGCAAGDHVHVDGTELYFLSYH